MMIKRGILIFGGFCLLFFALALKPLQADYVSVAAAAFRGDAGNEDYHIITTRGFWYKGIPAHYIMKFDKPGKLVAPVNFPLSFGTVTQMRVNLWDSNGKGRILVRLIRVDLETGEWAEVYKINSGKAAKRGPMIKTDSKGAHTGINNARYAWFIEADFSRAGQELGLYSVRLEFM